MLVPFVYGVQYSKQNTIENDIIDAIQGSMSMDNDNYSEVFNKVY